MAGGDMDAGDVDARAATRRFIDLAWSAGRYEEARPLLDPDFVNHTPVNANESRDEFLTRIAAFRAAFPDLTMSVDDMLVDGQHVVTRWSATGTHQGAFRGIEPTGAHVRFTGIAIDRVVAGRRVEGWAQLDMAGLLAQLESAKISETNGVGS
ncbi:ester cyclase [Microbacterium sp. ASV49]|uniref:Ester cyclase n=1 Tax=Microbacterium candidum TaxID=3041922 RepID=A0ABT7MWF9_9MICO|nr:ester cyclase [Microbacterium sp. ASV49]MDL9978787.1 ester cyclase [Microbacterium sp. ASV49]